MAKRKEKSKGRERGKANKKEISWGLIVAVLVLLFTILMFIFSFLMDDMLLLEETRIPVTVIVSNRTSFNITIGSDILHLGRVMPGTYTEREIHIVNTYPFPAKYEFDVEGDISDLLVFPKGVYLDAGQEIDIPFRTEVIKRGTEEREYSGNVIMTVKRFLGRFEE